MLRQDLFFNLENIFMTNAEGVEASMSNLSNAKPIKIMVTKSEKLDRDKEKDDQLFGITVIAVVFAIVIIVLGIMLILIFFWRKEIKKMISNLWKTVSGDDQKNVFASRRVAPYGSILKGHY